MFKGLGSALIGFTAAAIVAGVAVLVFVVTSMTHENTLALQTKSMRQVAHQTKLALTKHLESARLMADSLAAMDMAADALAGISVGGASMALAETVERNDLWAAFIFDPQGKVVAGKNAQGANMAGADRSERDYVQAILNGADHYFTKTILHAKSAEGPEPMYIYGVSVAVRDFSGGRVGGVAIFPKWRDFTAAFLQDLSFGERGYPFMLDASGDVIFHAATPELMLEDLSKLGFIQDALALEEGELYYPWKGEEKYLTVDTEPTTGWKLCMSAYVDEITEVAARQRNILLAVGGGLIAVLVLGLWWFLRKVVVRPIAAIETFTGRIAGGDFSASLDGTYRFEFKDLTGHIRDMVATLKERLGFAQGLLDGMTVPCQVSDPEGGILFVNQALVDLLDRDGAPESFKGMSTGEFVYCDASRTTNTCKALADRKVVRGAEVDIETASGAVKNVQVDAAPMYDLDGKLIAAFAIYTDLTGIRRQQAKIEAQNERIAQAARRADAVSDQVADAADQLRGRIGEASDGADTQRARTGEAATAMEEMNATVLEVARNAGEAAESAQQAQDRAKDGLGRVEATIAAIKQLEANADELRGDMSELGAQAEGIGSIMTVISDIADQTNLLALNAAIEAARAGDAGRGFAVVADEVRKLAEKTMSATSEVGGYIQAVQQSAKKSLDNADRTVEAIARSTDEAAGSGEALTEIVGMVESTADQVRAIATAAEQQSASSEEINRTTDEVNAIAGETAEIMQQSAGAVEELARLAKELKDIIGDMRED